jgi:hypothetical protein
VVPELLDLHPKRTKVIRAMAERKHLMNALAKIHRSASDLLGGEAPEPNDRPLA